MMVSLQIDEEQKGVLNILSILITDDQEHLFKSKVQVVIKSWVRPRRARLSQRSKHQQNLKTFGFANILLQEAFQFALQLVDKTISLATPLSVFLTASLLLNVDEVKTQFL